MPGLDDLFKGIAGLKLEPGDGIVVEVSADANDHTRKVLYDTFTRSFPKITVMIVREGLIKNIGVLKPNGDK